MKAVFKHLIAIFTCLAVVVTLFGGVSSNNLVSAADTRYERLYNQVTSSDKELYNAGCGLFASANAIYAFTGEKIDMADLKKWAKSVSGWSSNGGLVPDTFFPKLGKSNFAVKYGFEVSERQYSNYVITNKTIANKVTKGNVAALIGINGTKNSAGKWNGHWMLITDYDSKNNKYFVIDSWDFLPAASWVDESVLKNENYTGSKNYKSVNTKVTNCFFFTFNKPFDPGSISGEYYLKNNSTGTYAYMNGKDEKKADIALGENKETDAFKMKFTPVDKSNAQQGDVINPFGAKNCVVNSYSDAPVDGTNVNLWEKTSDTSQHWVFDKVDGGYVIRSRYDTSLVLTAVSGTVKLKTFSSGNKAQIWTLEAIPNPLSSISVSAPTKKEYYVGDKIDTSGMKVTAKYQDGSTKDVTSSAKVEVSLAETGEKEVTVSYTENSVTKTAKFTVTVKEVPEYFKGKGTADDPYLIEKSEDLVKFRDVINDTSLNAKFAYAYYKQTADIDLEKQDWIPIGIGIKEGTTSNDYNRMFHGVYDGGNHYIHNLKVTGDYMSAGLFGFTDGKYKENQGVVRNLVVDGVVNVPGSVNSGGIVGQMMSGSVIENCGFIGDVTGGAFEGSTFDAAGGITGCLYATGSIKNCYHTGNVTSKNCAAGIAGMIRFYKDNSGLKGSIENCYQANGKITSDGESGAITAKEMETGTDNKSSIVNCFADSVCGANIKADKVDVNTGMLVETSKIKKIAENLGEAFADGTADLNNGYPVLKWEVSSGIDLNADGKLNSADAVVLQKFILGSAESGLKDTAAADLNKNGRIDIADLCMIKSKLI